MQKYGVSKGEVTNKSKRQDVVHVLVEVSDISQWPYMYMFIMKRIELVCEWVSDLLTKDVVEKRLTKSIIINEILFMSKIRIISLLNGNADSKITLHKISHLNQHNMTAVYFQSLNIL